MGEGRAVSAVQAVRTWLLARQRADSGMWHDYQIHGYPELGDAIRGAYHFYPLFIYEGLDLPHPDAIIDNILRSQNAWGGFNPDDQPSGACEDIDAIDPLIRAAAQSGHRSSEIKASLRRALVWILSCRHPDGGYESLPEHGWSYGGHPLTTSNPGEPNLFATWFRTLCLAHVVGYLGLPNGFRIGTYPGYELAIAERAQIG
jgi:hypothetical protein